MRTGSFILDTFFDFLCPLHCVVTNNRIETNFTEIPFLSRKAMDSLPLASESKLITNKLFTSFSVGNIYIHKSFALFTINETHEYMNMIYMLKYFGFTILAQKLGNVLGKKIQTEIDIIPDCIIPVPIHHARKRERGNNQSDFIALGVAEKFKIPIYYNIIKRKVNTQTQTKLDKEQRKLNVEAIYKPGNLTKRIQNKNVLLIDDVMTTGATLNSLAKLCTELGAKQVFAASIVFAG